VDGTIVGAEDGKKGSKGLGSSLGRWEKHRGGKIGVRRRAGPTTAAMRVVPRGIREIESGLLSLHNRFRKHIARLFGEPVCLARKLSKR
jgi:hypothetical protein